MNLIRNQIVTYSHFSYVKYILKWLCAPKRSRIYSTRCLTTAKNDFIICICIYEIIVYSLSLSLSHTLTHRTRTLSSTSTKKKRRKKWEPSHRLDKSKSDPLNSTISTTNENLKNNDTQRTRIHASLLQFSFIFLFILFLM